MSHQSSETVPKLSISLVGHGFSRAKILVINYFANLKVHPTQKYLNFGTVSSVSSQKNKKKNLVYWCALCEINFVERVGVLSTKSSLCPLWFKIWGRDGCLLDLYLNIFIIEE